MSLLRNVLGNFVPVRERRESSATLAALNAEVVHGTNGCNSVVIHLSGGGATLNGTIEITGTYDGINFFPVLAFPLYGSGGTIPVLSQPLLLEAFNAANIHRVYNLAAGGMRAVRVRMSVYTAGSAVVVINSEPSEAIHPNVLAQKASTLMVTATAATGVAATATLPAVAGLRHYIDFIKIRRSATTVLTPSATPTVVTTTNLPGSLAITFGLDAAAQGVDKDCDLDFGNSGLAATAINTATTVVAPIVTGVIWRIIVAYRLGL